MTKAPLRAATGAHFRALRDETDPARQVSLVLAILEGRPPSPVSLDFVSRVQAAAKDADVDLADLIRAYVAGPDHWLALIRAIWLGRRTEGEEESIVKRIGQRAAQLQMPVSDLILEAVDAILDGRIQKRPGPSPKLRVTPDGPWTSQKLEVALRDLGLSQSSFGAAFNPPISTMAVNKWIHRGIPPKRQSEITRVMNRIKKTKPT